MLKQAIAFWKVRKKWLGDGGMPVVTSQAQRRADTCARCPLNRETVMEPLKAAVARELERQVEARMEMKLPILNGERDLHTCAACRCYLPTKVWVPLAYVRETTALDQLDPGCWILAEQRP